MGMKIIPVSDLRRSVSQIIKGLLQQDDTIYITQHGRPQAVLVSYEHYEQLLEQAKQSTARPDAETIRNNPEMIALVERIKATPPNPAAIRPATGSLAEVSVDTLSIGFQNGACFVSQRVQIGLRGAIPAHRAD